MAEGNTAVIDCGTSTIKGGLAFVEESEPRIVTPSVVRYGASNGAEGGVESTAGELRYPIESGEIKDWDAMEAIWHDLFYHELGWEMGQEGNAMVCEPLYSSRHSREMVAQLMFEVFNVSGLYMSEQPLLSLYAFGKLTGCVVEFGHGRADVAPVLEGQVVNTATARLEFAGQDMTEHWRAALARRGLDVSTAGAQELKDRFAKVAATAEEYAKVVAGGSEKVTHTLPDGNTITVEEERWAAGESIFRPEVVGEGGAGIAELIHAAIASCPLDNRRQMYENICICGGVGQIEGVERRLLAECKSIAPPSYMPSVAVLQPAEYMPEDTLRFSSWMGGAILAKVVFSQSQQVTKWDYDENGPGIVHRKCFS